MNKEIQNKEESEEIADDKNGIVTWVKAHKKQLVLIGISIPTLIAIVLGSKNKDAIKELFDNLKDEIEKANLYSGKWFENATDAELDTVREKVRLYYCSSGDDFKAACSLQNLLGRFDKEMSKRAWGNETPHAPSIHREHGWYLSNDD
jgi:hypothetical protein